MKKYFAICLLASSLIVMESSAQQKDSAVVLPPVTVTTLSSVNQQIDKSFKKGFPDAQDLKWYKMDEDYLAKFMKEDMEHNALYKKNGHLKYVVSAGYEHNLPENIRQDVQS